MKKILILLIMLLLLVPTTSFAAGAKKSKVGYVGLTYETKDNFIIKSKLFYPSQKKAVYPVVIFLHSIGYSSEYWGSIVKDFVNSGVAVVLVDLRGHGQSMYYSSFKISSWQYFSQKTFAKYPVDVVDIIKYIRMNYKDISQSKYAIVGADIGANTAILAAEKLSPKPKALVLLSPSRNFKGLYTPISMTNLGATPILTAISARDTYSRNEAYTLKKFAQGPYIIKSYPSGGMGMLMLKVNPTMGSDIRNFVLPKLK